MKRQLLFFLLAVVCMMANAQNQKRMYIHTKSGSVVEYAYQDIDSITFGNNADYAIDVQATNTFNLYYGSTDDTGWYLVCLSDAAITNDGLPSVNPQHLLRVYFNAKKSNDSNNAFLPCGHYELTSGTGRDSVYSKNTSYIEANSVNEKGEVDGFQVALKSLSADVNNNSDGSYSIKVTGVLDDGNDTKVRFFYTGKLDFQNNDPAYFVPLSNDVKVESANLSGGYSVNQDKLFGNYTLTYYNCPLDDDGFVVGAGQLMNFELLTPYAEHIDLTKLPGTYDVVMPVDGAVYEPGKYIGGIWTEFYGMYMPIGSYYTELDENGANKCYGLGTNGTVTVTVDGTQITLVSDLKTAEGYKMEMNIAADASKISDLTQSSGIIKHAMTSHSASFVPVKTKRTNVHNSGSIVLMKRN